ncbi:MAG: SIS domain-containing protein [Methanoregula sp.]|nr:SIS domain-containing protein [Methanoregula sp.]
MISPGTPDFTARGKKYLEFLNKVLINAEKEYPRIEHLIGMIQGARAIHIFGFGRSGAAALACAIRLRHFCNYLPPVWWVGDQVREPIRKGDVVILFSGSGNRPEVNLVARKAKKVSASLVLITANQYPALGARSDLVLILPAMQDLTGYGGGDFELGAFFLQEVLVTHLGKMLEIPDEEIGKNHV